MALTRPDVVREVHSGYLSAGSDIIETNTFNSTSICQREYSMEDFVYEINFTNAKIAKEVAAKFSKKNPEKPRFVAGVLGPTNKTLSISPEVNDPSFRAITFDELKREYREQAKALLDGGVDIFLIETVFDTLNCKAAICAVQELQKGQKIDIPVMISGTIPDISGRTLSGQTPLAFLISVSHAKNLLSVGFNCALGAKQLRPFLGELSASSVNFISAHPNAGLPNEFGVYSETPDEFSKNVELLLKDSLVNIIGGCCGTSFEHIRALSEIVPKYKPRIPQKNKKAFIELSGLEPLIGTPEVGFINVGERTNVSGSRKFAKLIIEENYDAALGIAREQVEGGAQVIDINVDEGMLDSKKVMAKLLNLMACDPEISKVPFMIDSSNWEVLEEGLKCIQGKSIINSISLKEGDEVFRQRACKVKEYGAAVVVMAFDENGQAVDLERRKEIFSRAYKILCNEIGFLPSDIIFDPNVLSVATGMKEHDDYARSFIESVAWIKKNLPGVKVSGGVSNLSFSFRGNEKVRQAMHSVFLYHAINAGLDMAIINPAQITVYDDIPVELRATVEDVILNRSENAAEELLKIAQNYSGKIEENKKESESKWRSASLEERLTTALVRGIVDYIESDLDELLRTQKISALEIIEKPLMKGINIVGDLFSQGKMFLPQVIKSARVMKKAVAHLSPLIESQKSKLANSKNPKIILATVKGDVHDIGKNIVSVVLSCNGFEIVDLGVMVPFEKIKEFILKEKPDILGLSGLITPSLEEMAHNLRELEKARISIPVIIGGATTSKRHTAIKLAGLYSGAVIQVEDASKIITVARQLVDPVNREKFILKNREEQKSLSLSSTSAQLISISEARKKRLKIDWDKCNIIKPDFLGVRVFKDFLVKDVRDYINWDYFFGSWQLKGKYPEVLKDKDKGKEAKELFEKANSILDLLEKDNVGAHGRAPLLNLHATIGFFAANSNEKDEIEIFKDEKRNEVIKNFSFLRQQQIIDPKKNIEENEFLSLSDFVAPKGYNDYLGLFALTAGIGVEKLVSVLDGGAGFGKIMANILCDVLAEAFSEKLHEMVGSLGIRPAPGYPTCPDHSTKRKIFELLEVEKNCMMSLTESFAMIPASSICGFYFANPKATYFSLGKIGRDQIEDYAKRNSVSVSLVEKYLAGNISY